MTESREATGIIIIKNKSWKSDGDVSCLIFLSFASPKLFVVCRLTEDYVMVTCSTLFQPWKFISHDDSDHQQLDKQQLTMDGLHILKVISKGAEGLGERGEMRR